MGTKFGGNQFVRRGQQHLQSITTGQSTLDNYEEESEKKINDDLEEYCDNLQPKERIVEKLNEKRKLIKSILSETFVIDDKHIFGSYARGTMVENPDGNDIDLMFILNEFTHGDWLHQDNGPSNCLSAIRDKLMRNDLLKGTEISIDKNAVSVKFSDIKLDVVPAFRDADGGYKIPNTTGSEFWIRTNPRMFGKILDASNKYHNDKVNKMIRIIKGWNNLNGKILTSFHIENIVYQHYKNKTVTTGNLADEVSDIFIRLPVYLQNDIKEPVYDTMVDIYLNPRKTDAIKNALETKTKILNAELLTEE